GAPGGLSDTRRPEGESPDRADLLHADSEPDLHADADADPADGDPGSDVDSDVYANSVLLADRDGDADPDHGALKESVGRKACFAGGTPIPARVALPPGIWDNPPPSSCPKRGNV